MKRILIVDDDQDICALLKRFLSRHDYEADTCQRGEDCLQKLNKDKFDLVLSDFRLPDIEGLELLKAIKAINADLPVIIITGYSDVKVAVTAIKMGAYDYVTKPIYPEEILNTIKNALDAKANPKAPQPTMPTKKSAIEAEKAGKSTYVIGDSPQARRVYQEMELIAPTNMSVIINGETGTGKEYVANEIHLKSKRGKGPFMAIDCGALPKDLAGSELFGHEKGAFTGAIKDKEGSFEMANGGTLFLDEIGNLSYDIQVKMLRVLQERKIRRVGGVKDIEVDVRILAATNEDLKAAVREGKFREDLYHRLNEFAIDVSPLRRRKEDIWSFAHHFLRLANEELEKSVLSFNEEAKEALLSYPWFGNLRELKNAVKRGVLLCQGEQIELQNLPPDIIHYDHNGHDHHHDMGTDLKGAAVEAEKDAILKALDECRGNKSKAAKLLNIDRKTLYNKLKSYGIKA
ncbi:sigma-54 dependent transcriptional regulator [soil metagenome]